MKEGLDVQHILDKISFRQVAILWPSFAALSGVAYYLLSGTGHGLLANNMPIEAGFANFLTAQYFSFSIAALGFQTQGIAVQGFSRLIAIIEVISGWGFFSIIVSKLLSQKQETVLQEVYDISFEEKINRIRSALYLFRSDISKITDKFERAVLSQRTIDDLWITFTTLENTMHEITRILKPKAHRYAKRIDDLSVELILTSCSISLSKAVDLLSILNEKSAAWQNDTIISIIETIAISTSNIQRTLRSREPNRQIIEKLDEVEALTDKLQECARLFLKVTA